ncbi:hypothetical protein [Bryocella elongata]|uniref:hypothetical protein n=1 Tax=Bryocella elongata TaxID=863522 RepID=UPI001F409170|nr:hypothetical protein [Bryocella elongata]
MKASGCLSDLLCESQPSIGLKSEVLGALAILHDHLVSPLQCEAKRRTRGVKLV